MRLCRKIRKSYASTAITMYICYLLGPCTPLATKDGQNYATEEQEETPDIYASCRFRPSSEDWSLELVL